MRNESITILTGNSAGDLNGSAIDVNQIVNLSVQAYCSVNTVVGAVKLQISNDQPDPGSMRSQFTPSHWVDVTNATATITAGESELIILTNCAFGYLRAVWTHDGGGSVGTITAQMSAVGV